MEITFEFVMGILSLSVDSLLIIAVILILLVPGVFLSGIEKHFGANVRRAISVALAAFLLGKLQGIGTIIFDILNPGVQYPIKLRLVLEVIGGTAMAYGFLEPIQALVRLGARRLVMAAGNKA